MIDGNLHVDGSPLFKLVGFLVNCVCGTVASLGHVAANLTGGLSIGG